MDPIITCKQSTGDNSVYKFFGETAPFNDKDPLSKEKAKKYLSLWKEMLLEKLNGQLHQNYELVDEQELERDKAYFMSDQSYLCLKLRFIKKIPYEL